ncbi:hypothetical protein A1Q2_02439 [Trichosporon asahii var. asahii CBS 8904]|uniref:Extracellular membrane protein CFEM domain-containing protein n=2 Tax=Trichosporon asahii var. asahii TaxID=189963 RepID=K1W2U8_TRIAC|nr:hypothetical protein A1Q1_00322 [Trichosporon asahii var. asahii CBS 2479]EJT50410.1 hypothetical protein A1Q1_00322 [Trichosporon asahii var. asahii CBS 2479]EKD03218.1 hypothetical protein A1Q2_02439 [Trichosporon asahii var. asahii CBS 8904]
MKTVFALAAIAAAAGVSAQVDASQINGCVKDCVFQTAKNVGCYNEADPTGSVNCICGDKRGDFTGQAAGCISGGCADQLAGAPALLDKLCNEGLKDGHW